MIQQKSFWYADLMLKNFLQLPMLKTVVLLDIFMEALIHFIWDLWTER